MKNVFVVAAHPDDEILGCGATMAKLCAKGVKVSVLICGKGEASRHDSAGNQALSAQQAYLQKCAKEANLCLGVKDVFFENVPDNAADTISRLEITRSIEGYIEKLKPEVIYTHCPRDLNVDHRRVAEAVLTACRPTPSHSVKEIYAFEVSSSTDWGAGLFGQAFCPQVYEDVSEFLGKKTEALEIYKAEMREWPHSRSIEAVVHLQRFRGASVGVNAAEGFEVLRVLR